jgi:hypothetical protein
MACIKGVCLNASAHGIDGRWQCSAVAFESGGKRCLHKTLAARATAANDARPPRSFEANVARRVIIRARTNTVSINCFPMRPNASQCCSSWQLATLAPDIKSSRLLDC